MEIAALANIITYTLVPLLPYLLKPNDKLAEDKGKRIAGKSWDQVKELWARLEPKVVARSSTLEAVHDVTEAPHDEDAQAALRIQFKKLLTEDETLAKALARLLHESRPSGSNVTASGERSVSIGGSVTNSSIITGDSNVVGRSGKIKHRLE